MKIDTNKISPVYKSSSSKPYTSGEPKSNDRQQLKKTLKERKQQLEALQNKYISPDGDEYIPSSNQKQP